MSWVSSAFAEPRHGSPTTENKSEILLLYFTAKCYFYYLAICLAVLFSVHPARAFNVVRGLEGGQNSCHLKKILFFYLYTFISAIWIYIKSLFT